MKSPKKLGSIDEIFQNEEFSFEKWFESYYSEVETSLEKENSEDAPHMVEVYSEILNKILNQEVIEGLEDSLVLADYTVSHLNSEIKELLKLGSEELYRNDVLKVAELVYQRTGSDQELQERRI
ncbi:hypothetical protein KY321_03855, partial [Candidatus Woesearchaeota archaeon]|nr:hypothetical protein [Candidatus Woesearchaeota archaeon]